MLRISKMADYGTLVIAYLATYPENPLNAKEIAEKTQLTLPTVSKLLKLLTRARLLISVRGPQGGYQLAQEATSISVLSIIDALDGKTGLTDCSHKTGLCSLEQRCTLHSHWKFISQMIRNTLNTISLEKLIQKEYTHVETNVLRGNNVNTSNAT
ncbi:MAG: HTH-type transcriptional regulator IscR [Legionellaceae bacterium]